MPKYRAGAAGAFRGRAPRGVIMGVADLMIVIPILVVSLFFIADLSQVGTNRVKLASILTQAANYAVSLPPEVDPAGPTEDLVSLLCIKNGLHSKKLKVTVEKSTLAGCDAISVSATADIPLLVGGALPDMARLQDQSTAIVPANRVYAAVAINPYPYSLTNSGAGASVYLPVIKPRSGLSVWQFPCDTSINNLHVVQGRTPEAPSSSDIYFSQRPSLY